jgi:hypothetical protein
LKLSNYSFRGLCSLQTWEFWTHLVLIQIPAMAQLQYADSFTSPRHHTSKTFELCEFVQHERRAPICEMRPLKPSQRTCLPSDDGLGACELRAGSTWTTTPAFSIAWSMPLSSLSTVGWSVPDYTVMVTHIDLRRHDTFHGQDKTVGKHGVLAYASRMLLLYFCWWL